MATLPGNDRTAPKEASGLVATVRQFARLSPRGRPVLTLADALTEEGQQIHGAEWRLPPSADALPEGDRLRAIYAHMHGLRQCALCLSGGGIRSAAFALGVMQTLAGFPERAEKRLMQEFHYLSTVSGGGYIGSWFSAWLSREHDGDAGANVAAKPGAVTRVLDAMSRRADDVEPIQISNLRENSSYLTPQAGLLSGDMWAAIGTLVRNLLVNWMVVLPLLVLLVLGAKIISWRVGRMVYGDGSDHAIMAVTAILLILATSYRVANRPSLGVANRPVSQFVVWHIVPAVLAALGFAILVGRAVRFEWGLAWWHYALIGTALYAVSWAAGRWLLWRSDSYGVPAKPSYAGTDWFWWSASGAVFGTLVAAEQALYVHLSPDWALRAVVMVGPPMIILAQMVAELCFTAVISLTQAQDEDREWLARAGGMYVLVSLLGALFFALVILAPISYDMGVKTVSGAWTTWLASIGGVAGLAGAILGASGLTGAARPTRNDADRSKLPIELLIKLAAPLFGAALFVATSLAVDEILFQGRFENTGLFGEPGEAGQILGPVNYDAAVLALWYGLGVSLALLGFIPWRVNINRFSIHSFYRNRLIRAFLAASRSSDGRKLDRPLRNCFTDIDPDDNVRMRGLWDRNTPPKGENWRPLHVVNMALNIVSSRKLAWQERKAEPFTVTPLHSGSGCSSFEGSGAFQWTENYGDREGLGISLGTAMAISGAAASPNMGYHSSPAVTFLMALFNVRLGWWLANPGKKGDGRYATDGPRWALRPYLDEMFGRTEDDRRYVYLSDGGHFENLGLYEMVRRRCRYVVVSDASADPEFRFDSLGNAIRKIGIDFGIRIEMIGLDALAKRSEEPPARPAKAPYHAMGVIHYADVDGAGVADGILLYIKPGVHWAESADVQNYARMHPTFPHESTGNQWFTESQFESYRRLGVDIAWPILEEAAAGNLRYPHPQGLGQLLEVLLDQAQARRRAI